MPELPSYRTLDQCRREAGLDTGLIWAAYFALGGHHSVGELTSFLTGDSDLPDADIEILEVALAEAASDRGHNVTDDLWPGREVDPVTFDLELRTSDGPGGQAAWMEAATQFALGNLSFILSEAGHVDAGPPDPFDFQEPDPRRGRMISVDRDDQGHWEVHPAGDEALIALTGALRIEFVAPNQPPTMVTAGHVLLIPQNSWHRHVATQAGTRILKVTPLHGTRSR
jgi:hypothetical protein